MTQVTIDTLQKNFQQILKLTGQNSYINWDIFSKGSNQVIQKLDILSKQLALLREQQQKNFIQTMRKLKGIDIPDVIKSVIAKKLPRQALKTILPRFRSVEGKIQLVQNVQILKQIGRSQFNEFANKNMSLNNLLEHIIESIKSMSTNAEINNETQKLINEEAQKIMAAYKQKFKFSEGQIQNYAKNIKIQYFPNTKFMNTKSYGDLINTAGQLVKQKYNSITIQTRKKQRQNIKNPQRYLQILNEYIADTQTLVMRGQVALSQKLGFNQKFLEVNQQFLIQKGQANNLIMVQSYIRNKLKQSIPTKKQVSANQAKQLLLYQVSLIKQKSQQIKQIFKGLPRTAQSSQLIPILLSLILNDYVFLQKNIQQEDYVKHLNQQVFLSNPQLTSIFQQMQRAIIQLMQNIQFLPKNLNQLNVKNQGKQFTPEGIIPPGMDPMTYLQLQQMQAVQSKGI